MGIEESTQKQWMKLNEYEQAANDKEANRPERDFSHRPWTQDDDAGTQLMVHIMTGRLARIEQRQAVLYQMLQSLLGTINAASFAVLAGVGVWAVLAVVEWLRK